MSTIQQINTLANERHHLWRVAGKRHLTAAEQQRIGTISAQLSNLWEKRRREKAGVREDQVA